MNRMMSGKYRQFLVHNPSPHSATYMRPWTGSALASEPMLDYRNKRQWFFSFTKMHLKISSPKMQPFCPGGDELMCSLQWRHNECYGVSNHQRLDHLLVCRLSGANQRQHQSSAPMAFVRGIHRWPVDSPHKRHVTRKMLPFDDVIM